jgi:uncharacterized protein (TIGR01777 family)
MRVAITGSTGLVGTALVEALKANGHTVSRIMRDQHKVGADDVFWNPDTAYVDTPKLDGTDAIVHLAGEPISRSWSPEQKKIIHFSRLRGTQLIAEAARAMYRPPQVLISGSAIGWYGDRGDEVLREDSKPGTGFLSDVCRDWEGATEVASRAGIRVVHLRTGIVLSSKGGALAKMLPPFRMGVGGKVGSGRQYMSWVALDDVASAIIYAINTPSLQGPMNVVAPNPATNLQFTKALGKVLNRPTIAPLPALVVKLLFGEMGETLLLASQRVEPARLLSAGYQFQYPQLEAALRRALVA